MDELERCFSCDEPTGRAGISDDSIYISTHYVDLGPFCLSCFNDVCRMVDDDRGYSTEIARLREALEQHHKWSIGGVEGYAKGTCILYDLTATALASTPSSERVTLEMREQLNESLALAERVGRSNAERRERLGLDAPAERAAAEAEARGMFATSLGVSATKACEACNGGASEPTLMHFSEDFRDAHCLKCHGEGTVPRTLDEMVAAHDEALRDKVLNEIGISVAGSSCWDAGDAVRRAFAESRVNAPSAEPDAATREDEEEKA